ncbi:hypothetical protein SAMN05660297_01399 [Natronincola peptidivorans]|uniref:Uncharacterized protein n=1 Tax=Natronincola peptidivorans TaxID=426128 RepID=A0A1I0BU21_9FIRM|nr:hypothetical protein SAMN05660297_01399 [Natronincola peptidivorans]
MMASYIIYNIVFIIIINEKSLYKRAKSIKKENNYLYSIGVIIFSKILMLFSSF